MDYVGRRRSLAQVSGISLSPDLNREANGMAAGGCRVPFPVLIQFMQPQFLRVVFSAVLETVAFAGDGSFTLDGNRICMGSTGYVLSGKQQPSCQGLRMAPPKLCSQNLFPHEPWL